MFHICVSFTVFCLHLFHSLSPYSLAHSLFLPLFRRECFKISHCAHLGVGSPLEGDGWAGEETLVFSAIPLDEALEQGNESFGKGLETSHSSV